MVTVWKGRRVIGAAFLSALMGLAPVEATTIEVGGAFHFRSNTGVNSAGINPGDTQKVGVVSAAPNGDEGTKGIATYTFPDSTTFTRDLLFDPTPNAPNRFIIGPDYDPNRTGSWQLSFTHEGATTQVATPNIDGVALMPFVKNVKLTGAGSAPTISWTVPVDALAAVGLNADYMVVLIRDLDAPDSKKVVNPNTGRLIAPAIASTPAFDPSMTSVTLNSAFLQGESLEFGHRYSIQIGMQDTRDGRVGRPRVQSNSVAFFDFTPLKDDPSGGAGVLLPTVQPGQNGGAPVFTFDADVGDGEVLYIDPLIAVGYDYAIGVGDPNFASVLLPALGDDLFQLWLWSGVEWVYADMLSAGVEYMFAAGGVDRFRILGIEAGAMLNPEDPTAFVTGLTFTSAGTFTGTMTAIVAAVPMPGSLVLVLLGLVYLRRRR